MQLVKQSLYMLVIQSVNLQFIRPDIQLDNRPVGCLVTVDQ
jgi:hypothetical protein